LFWAAFRGELEQVRSLCGDPDVNINWQYEGGFTPFLTACSNGHKEVVLLLLADPRIDPNRPRNDQSTPLYMAAQQGHFEIIQTMLASSREVDTKRRIVTEDPVENGKTAAEWVRALGTLQKPDWMEDEGHKRVRKLGSTIADLIDAYEKDPAKVRSQLRKQLGPRGILPTHLSPFVFKINCCSIGIDVWLQTYLELSSISGECRVTPLGVDPSKVTSLILSINQLTDLSPKIGLSFFLTFSFRPPTENLFVVAI